MDAMLARRHDGETVRYAWKVAQGDEGAQDVRVCNAEIIK